MQCTSLMKQFSINCQKHLRAHNKSFLFRWIPEKAKRKCQYRKAINSSEMVVEMSVACQNKVGTISRGKILTQVLALPDTLVSEAVSSAKLPVVSFPENWLCQINIKLLPLMQPLRACRARECFPILHWPIAVIVLQKLHVRVNMWSFSEKLILQRKKFIFQYCNYRILLEGKMWLW